MWGYPNYIEFFRSELPPAQLLSRVATSATSATSWGLLPGGWTRCIVNSDNFEIRRIKSISNGFPPVLTGWVKPELNGPGSWLKLRYSKQSNAVGSSVVGAIFILVFTSVLTIPAVQAGQLSKICLLIPPAVLAIFATLVVASFRFDIWLARRQIGELLELEMSVLR